MAQPIQIRVRCTNRRCQFSGVTRIVAAPVVAPNVLAFPRLVCAGCLCELYRMDVA